MTSNAPVTQAPILEDFSDASANDLMVLARITETAERFEDMCSIMGELVRKRKQDGVQLDVEARNMLSVAYKNVVGQRRASWRTLKSEDDCLQDNKSLKDEYKRVVEMELETKCNEVLVLLEESLIEELQVDLEKETLTEEENALVETQVFYLKMCGDYYRYLAEFSDVQEHRDNASARYNEALGIAEKVLASTHPTRLGLALNASVCYYEIMQEPLKACELAKKAFDEAIQKLDSINENTYKDSTLIMQLLRDNLTIWSSENEEQRED